LNNKIQEKNSVKKENNFASINFSSTGNSALNFGERTAILVYRTISNLFKKGSTSEVTHFASKNKTSQKIADNNKTSQNSTSSKNKIGAVKKTQPTVIVNNPIKEIVKETVVERVIKESGITLQDLQKIK